MSEMKPERNDGVYNSLGSLIRQCVCCERTVIGAVMYNTGRYFCVYFPRHLSQAPATIEIRSCSPVANWRIQKSNRTRNLHSGRKIKVSTFTGDETLVQQEKKLQLDRKFVHRGSSRSPVCSEKARETTLHPI